MIEHDSIIPPGREGKISVKIKVKDMLGGLFRKSIRFTMTSAIDQSYSLTVKGIIKKHIYSSQSFISLKEPEKRTNPAATYAEIKDARDEKKVPDIVLHSDMTDLLIKEVCFIPEADSLSADIDTIKIPFLTDRDINPGEEHEKYYVNHLGLTLFLPKKRPLSANLSTSKHPLIGTFIIRTNHAKKGELRFMGQLKEP